ncbi:MAG: HD-GYP domain-containing protein [Thermoleophilia bacterium]
MKRLFAVMVVFGLTIGLIFPVVVNPFVTWNPDRRIFFQFACLAAGFAVGSFCYFIIKISLYRQKLELEKAKDNFTSLTETAIRERDWSVELSEPYIPTCWKVKKCNHADCPAYGKHNVRCWLIAGTFCGGEVQGRFAQKLTACSECEVYANTVKQNPISEIGENFNSLMWEVHERESALAVANARLQEMAITDSLTGLKNHGNFQDQLEHELARAKRFGHVLSVIILDLDNFKNVNDKFGHQMGDTVLKNVGRLLMAEVREMDYSARYGGEEFVIILPETAGHEAAIVAEKLRIKIKEKVADETGLPSTYIGASFGIADYPRCAGDKDSLIAAADSALLFSKRRGRNQVSFFLDLTNIELSEGDIEKLSDRLGGAGLQTIYALAETVDYSDGYSGSDTQRISDASKSVAAAAGMSKEQTESLIIAIRLHDIGKVGVPDSILSKKDGLSPDELSKVHQHPEIGKRILHEAAAVKDVVSAILYHHENWDGSGYPERLKGEEIPLMARIVSISDAFRAMVSDRPYRKALVTEQAITELHKGAGRQFDPVLVELFILALEREEQKPLLEAV